MAHRAWADCEITGRLITIVNKEIKMEPENCYCKERKVNPDLANSLKDIPEGYCGICETCGKPGHTKAHPSSPTTSAWCDEHWNELISYKTFSLGDIVPVIFLLIVTVSVLYALYNLWSVIQ